MPPARIKYDKASCLESSAAALRRQDPVLANGKFVLKLVSAKVITQSLIVDKREANHRTLEYQCSRAAQADSPSIPRPGTTLCGEWQLY